MWCLVWVWCLACVVLVWVCGVSVGVVFSMCVVFDVGVVFSMCVVFDVGVVFSMCGVSVGVLSDRCVGVVGVVNVD